MNTATLTQLADHELSLGTRLGYVALLLASMMMSTVIGALWLTEPALPVRTQAAFGVMLTIGASWIGFAIWALATRAVLLARQRVVASTMALVFSAVFAGGATAVALSQNSSAAYGAAAVGLLMTATAAAMLAGARRKLAALLARKEALERQLAPAPHSGG